MKLQKKLTLIFLITFIFTIFIELFLGSYYFEKYFFFRKNKELQNITFIKNNRFSLEELKRFQEDHRTFSVVLKNNKILNLDNFDYITLKDSKTEYIVVLNAFLDNLYSNSTFDLGKNDFITIEGITIFENIIVPTKIEKNNEVFIDYKLNKIKNSKKFSGIITNMNNAYGLLEKSDDFLEHIIDVEIPKNGVINLKPKNSDKIDSTLICKTIGDFQVLNFYDFQDITDIFPTIKSFFIFKIFLIIFIIFILERIIQWLLITPIIKLSKITSEIEKLNFCKETKLKRKDEIGDLYLDILKMSDSLKNIITLYKNEIHSSEEANIKLEENIKFFMHEIKTPLSAIIGFSNLLLEEKFSDEINIINKEGKRLLYLANELIDQEKEEVFNLNPINFNLNTLIDLSIKIFKLNTPHIEFIFSPVKSYWVEGDRGKIEQVIFNIIKNGVHFTKNKIIISLSEDKNNVYISIENNGPKFENGEEKKIWEKFYSKNGKNRGLGLYISYKILNFHGSKFYAENCENGVKFVFSLKKV